MKRLQNAFLAIAIALLMTSPVHAADPQTVGGSSTSNATTATAVVGLVVDPDNHFVNGVYIEVLDASGKKVGDGRTDIYGRYCIPVKPGKYTFVLDPAKTGFLGGQAVGNVDIEGLTINWHVSKTTTALATSDLGVASAASATCGAAWWETAAALSGAGVLAGGVVGGVLWGESSDHCRQGDEGHCNPPSSPAQ